MGNTGKKSHEVTYEKSFYSSSARNDHEYNEFGVTLAAGLQLLLMDVHLMARLLISIYQ